MGTGSKCEVMSFEIYYKSLYATDIIIVFNDAITIYLEWMTFLNLVTFAAAVTCERKDIVNGV